MVNSVTQPRLHLWSRVEDANFCAGRGAADDYMFCSLFRLTTLACRTVWQAPLLQRGFEAADSSAKNDSPRSIGCAAGLLLLHPPGSLAAVCPAGPEIGVRNSLCLLQGDNCHFVGFGEMSGDFGSGKALDIELEHWQTLFSASVLTVARILFCQLDNTSATLVSWVGLGPFLTTLSHSQTSIPGQGAGASQRIGVHVCVWIQPNSYQAYDINYCFWRLL